MGPERKIEARLRRLVHDRGGMCLKLAPTVAGLPDRLVLLPEARFFLVELKAPRGRLRPIQVFWHAKAAGLGIDVVVLASDAEVDEWLLSLDSE